MNNQAIIRGDESIRKGSSANLENVNSSALSSVQTSFTTQASNGCKVTAHFAYSQNSEIEQSVASM